MLRHSSSRPPLRPEDQQQEGVVQALADPQSQTSHHTLQVVQVQVDQISQGKEGQKIWTFSLATRHWWLRMDRAMDYITRSAMDKWRIGTTWSAFGRTRSSSISVSSQKIITSFSPSL